MSLKISKELSLPADFVTQTCSIMAMRRVGKTYTASVLAEELVAASLPFVVLDPTGAWWGLRASADGKSEGLPVIIIGGEHADVPLEPTAGKVIADLVVDHPGFYVVDLSSTESNAEQDRFATAFAERLYRRKNKCRDPLHLFVDEADSFAPQRPLDGQLPMLGAFEAIVRRGGIRGIGTTLITQRPAVLNKNVFTQTEVLIVLQLNAPQDQDAIDDWVKRNGTKEQRDIMMQSLASLPQGRGWLWSPAWLRVFKEINIRQRRTFNSSATPKAGEKVIMPKKLAKVDLDRLGKEIAATIERANESDPSVLKKQLNEAKQQIAHLKQKLEKIPAAPIKTVETKIERVEVPLLTESQDGLLSTIQKSCEKIASNVEQAANLVDVVSALRQDISDKVVALQKAIKVVPVPAPPTTKPASPASSVPLPTVRVHTTGESKSPLSKCAASILTVLLSYPSGRTRGQAALLSGYSVKSSTFGNGLTELSKHSAITRSGDMLFACPPEAAALLPNFEPLPTGSALREHWLSKLGGAAHSMFSYLLDKFPDYCSREELAEQTGYSMNSSTFGNALTAMRAPDLIEENGKALRASPTLFES